MKRLRSFGDDLDSVGGERRDRDRDRDHRDRDRERSRERERDRSRERERDLDRSSSHRRFHYRGDDDRRKRVDYEFVDGFDRRKTSDNNRYRESRDSSDRGGGVLSISPRNVGYGNGIHRSESFSGFRREFPKGYVSEREKERSRREESVSSWRRLSGCKEIDEEVKSSGEVGRGSRSLVDDRVNVKSPQGSREVLRSPQGSLEALRSPQGSREALRSPQGSREALRSPQGSREALRSPQGSREGLRSPQCSRDVLRSPQSSREVAKSPQGSRDVVKSPPGSKESSGEQSMSNEVKKSEDLHAESSSSSEMEEGEFEPESEPEASAEVELPSEGNSNSNDFDPEEQTKMATDLKEESEKMHDKAVELNTKDVSDENGESESLDAVTVALKGADEVHKCLEKSSDRVDFTAEKAAVANANPKKEENIREVQEHLLSSDVTLPEQKDRKDMKYEFVEKSLHLDEAPKEETGMDLPVEEVETNCVGSNELIMEESVKNERTLILMTDTLNGKDKGKSVMISTSCETTFRGNGDWVERDLLACKDDAIEGPSSRGFELFSSSILAKHEKAGSIVVSNGGKLKSEPLDLSLGLPNVLLPLPSLDTKATPSSPSHVRSIQSLPNTFRTNSEGFSGSMSFSGSQTFIHNASCSLTQNSFENFEQSVGSHPIFQGIDQPVSHITWPGPSSIDPKSVESPIYQRFLYGNGPHPSQTSQGIKYPQPMQVQQKCKLSEGSSGVPASQDRQSNLHRQLSGLQSQNHIEVRSPTNSVGSRETGSESCKKRIVKERNDSLQRSNSQREMNQHVVTGSGFVERIITMIVSEPIQVMARRIEEMAEQSIVFLKESACDIIMNKDKRAQFHTYKEVLQNRSDLTVEILSKSHRAQLEILVAFRTGLQEFLQRAAHISPSYLAEIYLSLRCRNLACLSLLPVDECDCKVCVQKNGFCSACMCLICSKYDMALNTCSWVGCDVCLHWCHTDCGLRKSYIRNGSFGEATEMQFHCVACNHPSEMFGFVKDVFKSCAKEWKVENLSKELECVKRIFSASTDPRGKQMHVLADQMIARLRSNSNLSEVYKGIMRFLTETDTGFARNSSSLKELSHRGPGVDSNGYAEPRQADAWLVSPTENIPHGGSGSTDPPKLNWDKIGVCPESLDLQGSLKKMPVVDELESIIRIKHAEAKMFQERADDARKEAEGLKRIAVAKNEKIDEEFSSRFYKLRMVEAEERRKKKLDELKVMEREHREYFGLKMRMESEIGVLLRKMEATKRNFST